jgi:ribose transport system ATP-binding protein
VSDAEHSDAEQGVALTLEGIQKSFGRNAVLRGVSFGVARGTVHALLGENGAGKSTLMKIALGLEALDAGAMRLAGAPYRPRGPAEARRAGVVIVPQERTLCLDLSVVENIVLGIEPTRRGVVLRREARETARRALALVTGDEGRVPLDARVRALSVADRQLVEIARALAQAGEAAKVLVLDEPTSSLGKDDAERLFSRVRALSEAGLAVLLVTHFLGDVRAHTDRYTVLRDGQVSGEGDPKTTPPEQIVHEMLGRELEQVREDRGDTLYRDAPPKERGEVLLEVKGLAGRKKPTRVSFTLHRGEVLGIAGLVGSGRTELLRAIAGLDPRTAGTVETRAGGGVVGLLSEDRGGEGLMLRRSIADNVDLSPRGARFVRPSAVLAAGERWIAELAIKARGPTQRAGELSGGNQQKVQIARMLREDYDVLLVDEPTRGIDVASKAQVLSLLRGLADKGKGIVLVSSQLDELVTACDRIAVMRAGVLGEPREGAKWTEEALLLEAAS